MGRPRGSENKDKPFRKALRIEIAAAGEDHKALRLVARALISKAQEGDVQAIKEVADRLDGKPVRAIEHGNPGEFDDMSDADLYREAIEAAKRLGLPAPTVAVRQMNGSEMQPAKCRRRIRAKS